MRITNKMLDHAIENLNRTTGNPLTTWVRQEDGSLRSQVAYGGVDLEQIGNTSGGVHKVFNCGYTTKRQLFDLIKAFTNGIELSRGSK